MKTYILTLLSLFILSTASAQLPGSGVSTQSGVLDGVYIQEHIPTKRVVQYAHLREADVMWGKRVWRTLDMREKMNHKLYYPLEKLSDRLCLYDVIKYGALEEGSLTIYDLNGLDLDDKFRFPVRPTNGNVADPDYKKRLEGFFGYVEERDSIDNEGNVAIDDDGNDIKIEEITQYEARDIIQYKIKEDWFFDKQRSILDVRIIGNWITIFGGIKTKFSNLVRNIKGAITKRSFNISVVSSINFFNVSACFTTKGSDRLR